jgi:lysophospholipase L1-like esterase
MLRTLTGAILKGSITTIIFFALAEGLLRGAYAVRAAFVHRVPLPYSVGDDYGPVPPWLDNMMILVPDDRLIWRNLPNVRRTYVDIFSPAPDAASRTALLRRFAPTLPAAFEHNPTWSIALDSRGYRNAEIALARKPGVLRVACIGDSWTFGMNVDQDRSYPARLAEVLRAALGGTPVEVVNFGVLGYSSFQGRQLLTSAVFDFQPDIVALGFGMNDSEVAGYRDRDMVGNGDPPKWTARVRDSVAGLESYKLLRYYAQTLRFRPKSMGDFLLEHAADRGSGSVEYDAIEPWTRVSPHDYETNMREMIRLSRAHAAAVVLLDNELWEGSPYRPVLRRIASDERVPLVDSLAIVAAARERMERDIESRFALRGAGEAGNAAEAARESGGDANPEVSGASRSPGRTRVVFRVSRGDYPVRTAISIVGTDSKLGATEPNAVQMHDDGTGGDERANDGVWSLAADFAPGTHLTYVYTNSGARGKWEGLDVPHLRDLVVPASTDGRAVYLPIETFGRVYMQADDWHTDAVGYDLIARAVAGAIHPSYSSAPSYVMTPSRSRTMRVAKSRAKSSSCVEISSVRPWCRSSASRAPSSARRSGSSDAVGSSISRTGGSTASARAMATRCASPPDSCRGSASAR